MDHTVTSVFSVTSKRLGAEYLRRRLPWKIVETAEPNENIDHFITVFDLGVGHHDRVDRHLERATEEMFTKLIDLEQLLAECKYTLWVRYRFPSTDGAANIPSLISSRLAHLQVDLIFGLNDSG